ncbi:hypothetical protein BZG30_31720, partial [Escherichia coli]|nr:hypothetical protein [Escherichia coli]
MFLNTIFSPGATETLLGTKAKPPSSLPSKTSLAMALLARIALAAVAATATPTSLRDDLTMHICLGEAETFPAARPLAALEELSLVHDGIVRAAGVT